MIKFSLALVATISANAGAWYAVAHTLEQVLGL